MDLDTLRRFSLEGYGALAPERFSEAASFCHERAINTRDIRFVVLGTCFELSRQLWTPGEAGGARAEDALVLQQLWKRELPGILDAESEEVAETLALHLKDEIRSVLANASPP